MYVETFQDTFRLSSEYADVLEKIRNSGSSCKVYLPKLFWIGYSSPNTFKTVCLLTVASFLNKAQTGFLVMLARGWGGLEIKPSWYQVCNFGKSWRRMSSFALTNVSVLTIDEVLETLSIAVSLIVFTPLSRRSLDSCRKSVENKNRVSAKKW